jgi:hypothetical protein
MSSFQGLGQAYCGHPNHAIIRKDKEDYLQRFNDELTASVDLCTQSLRQETQEPINPVGSI